MKWALPLLFSVSIAGAADLTAERTVFILSMNHSLDQFIANRLTRMHVLQVVTDPTKADTVISDRVGDALQAKLDDLYPPPKAKPEVKEAAAKTDEATDTTASDSTAAAHVVPPVFGDTANTAARQGNMATTGHGRGTVFLVDVKSRQVLWSVLETPKNSTPRELDHVAERIVKHLKDDLTPKKK